MIFSSRNYAIGMAHYQIVGGTKSLLGVGAAYLAGAASIIGIVLYNTEPIIRPGVMRSLFTLFFVIEGFMLVLLGAFRVAGSIRTDFMTNMIESHRQMPIAAWRAVLGYLFGTTAHVMVLAALNLIVLAILGGAAHVQFDNFIVSQIVLAAFAMFIWTFAAMNTFMFRQVAPLMVLGMMVGGITSAFVRNFGILPGVSLLISPFLGESIFNLSGGIFSIRAVYPIALTAQAAFAALFFVGACRRYRGTFLTTFNVPLALGLIAVWSLLSLVSIHYWPEITKVIPGDFGPRQPSTQAQIVAALFLAAVLMLVPVHALAAWEDRHDLAGWRRAGALAATILVGMLIVLAGPFNGYLWGISLVIITLHVITIYAGLRAFRIFTPITVLVLMAGVFLMEWLVPLMAEGILLSLFPTRSGTDIPSDYSLVGAISPLGLLIKMWTDEDATTKVLWGLLAQAAVAMMLWRLGTFMARRNPRAGNAT